jgi:hypothetical protein
MDITSNSISYGAHHKHIKSKFAPLHTMKEYRGRSIASHILNLGIIWRWVNFMPWPLYHLKRIPVTIE